MPLHHKPTKTEIPRQINASVLPPPISPLRMQRVRSAFVFGTMCSACTERDAHFVRDVSFGSDVRFARKDAEHITSLCTAGAIHHCASALHHYGEAICYTPITLNPFRIHKSEISASCRKNICKYVEKGRKYVIM